ncbi:YqgE/AlgH family protein [uncultured Sphingomonas sp.]|jgi:putative transcriptional regulator|uniref:YqgE/AlgH family protein n=1 Tax=uncultured Sphingomonas sp. TaxID=158754 RepID=UPI002603605D|nr:YqgE/AlgH family protein [uncultured Sphingomonas sp.]
MQSPPFLVGQLLLAMPGIGDSRFERAVIAMCVHDENGALGIGIGSLVPEIGLHALMRQLDVDPGQAPDARLHRGGPVEPHRGFVIHSDDWGGEGSIDVAGRWRLTATLDILRALAEGRGPTRWLAALGYAGWSAGQLDAEMARHGWFGVPGDDALIFDERVSQRWTAGYAAAGIDTRMLSAESGHA